MTTGASTIHAIGIDIGGTGIKGALVDLSSGELVRDRLKVATPAGGEPKPIATEVVRLVEQLGDTGSVPIGVCFPAVVLHGRTMSAANVSKKWIGLEAEALFERSLNRDILFINDADAAGVAEVQYGAAKDESGLVVVTTLGTGIGTALIYDGVLIPNSELGHLEIDGRDAERRAAYSAKERRRQSWKAWAKHVQKYFATLEALLSPDLFIVGGGVSKNADEFLPLLNLRAPIVPATHRNNAGILGAAWLAANAGNVRVGCAPRPSDSRMDHGRAVRPD
jgi:polyphosphate glucokinase